MKINASAIANYFLDKASDEGRQLSLLKLVKLVYIAQGWILATLDRDGLNGEAVQAWQHGPVIPSIYHEFKEFGKKPITKKAKDVEYINNSATGDITGLSIKLVEPFVDKGDKSLVMVLDYVWNIYKKYSAFDLVNMTHEQDTPWSKTYKKGKKNLLIDNELIKAYYKDYITDLLNTAQEQEAIA